MKLFYSPGACSLATHIVALEAGSPATYETVDLRAKKTESGADFMQINPKGYVPALQLDSGDILTEVSAVIQYLAHQAPGSGLMPEAGTPEHFRVLEWIGFISAELHKGFGPLFNPATPDAYKTIAIANLNRRLAYLNAVLDGRSYLVGDRFTVADAYLFTILRWTGPMKIDMAGLGNVAAYMDRVGNRERVRQALVNEGLLKAA